MSLLRRRRQPVDAEESDGSVLLRPGGLDPVWYRRLLGTELSREDAVTHYLDEGRARGLTPHPLIDPEFLMRGLAHVPAGRDPVAVYLRDPRRWTIPTHPLFATAAWISAWPDALTYPGGPAEHCLRVGLPAGHMPSGHWPAGDDVVGRLAQWTRELAGLEPAPAEGLPSDVVVRCTGHLPRLTRFLDSVAAVRGDVPVVVPTAGLSRSSAFAVALMGRTRPWLEVAVCRVGTEADSALADIAARLDPDAPLVIVDSELEATPGWIEPLITALDDPRVAVATSVVVDGTGVIRSAGMVPCEDGGVYPLLAGFAGQELAPGGRTEVPMAGDRVIALRAGEIGSAGSRAGALQVNGRTAVVCHDSVVVQRDDREVDAGDAQAVGSGSVEVAAWARVGIAVLHEGGEHRFARTAPRPLHWAIKCPAPFGPSGETWGDLHFARELASAVRRRGHRVVIDSAEAFDRPTTGLDDVSLVIRGLMQWVPAQEHARDAILWAISHPDDITREEADAFGVVAAASGPWASEAASRWGRRVEALLQATDPTLFHPDCAVPDTGPEVLFVGVNKGGGRPLVDWAVDAGLPLRVFGPGWGSLPEGMWLGERIARDQVPALYRSSGLVLCEHAEEMASEGFVQNRVLDVLAAGGRAVSNPVVGMESVVEGVATVSGAEELRALFEADLREVFGDDAEVRLRSQIVAREHSFDARAETLERLIGARSH